MKEGYCSETVMRWPDLKQCSRKAWKDGWCKQHHPDTVEERRKKADEAYAEKHSPIRRLKRQLEDKTKQCEELANALEAALKTEGLMSAQLVLKKYRGES